MRHIDMDEVDAFREEAARKNGGKPCEHKKLLKEYHLGAATGDYICEDCGDMGYGSDWPSKQAKKSNKL